MSTLSWTLSTEPPQAPEYWLLFVDGFACIALSSWAPYTGPGSYSVDLAAVAAGSATPFSAALPTDSAPHQYSVALVGQGVVGPQSAAVSIALPTPSASVLKGSLAGAQQITPSVVWPSATALTST